MSKLLLVIATFGVVTLQVGCSSVPKLIEYTPSDKASDYQKDLSAPIILVGQLWHETAVSSKIRPSKWGDGLYAAMWRVTIRVENVLRGTVQPGDINVYYFQYNLSGPARVGTWWMGDRKLFFLRRDAGVLRTICDGWSTCVIPVLTGYHPGFQPNPGEPMSHTIIDLLLTRGEYCSDKDMVKAIGRTKANLFSNEYAMQKLRQIASTETPEVRQAACEALFSFGHPCAAAKSTTQ
jgi:hypothetical protein